MKAYATKKEYTFHDVTWQQSGLLSVAIYMEMFDQVTVHCTMLSDSLSASQPNTTQRFSVF